jgi:hypothetical protein
MDKCMLKLKALMDPFGSIMELEVVLAASRAFAEEYKAKGK